MRASVLSLIGAIVAAAALAHHLHHAGGTSRTHRGATARGTDWGIRGLLGGLACYTLADWPPCATLLDQQYGIPDLAVLVRDMAGIVSALATEVLFLYATRPDQAGARGARRVAVATVAAATGVTAFARAHFTRDDPTNFLTLYAGKPELLAYLAAFLGFLLLASLDVLRLSTIFARQAPTRALRLGSRLVSGSCLSALAYVAFKTELVIDARRGVHAWTADQVVSPALATCSIIAIGIAFFAPSATCWLRDVEQLPALHRRYRALHPLWYALYTAFPEDIGVLNPPRHPQRPGGFRPTAGRRLYRQVIEIHDGLRRLQPYIDEADRRRAAALAAEAGATPQQATTEGDVAAIAAAIKRRTSSPPGERSPRLDSTDPHDRPTTSQINPEIDRLIELSHVYAQSFATSAASTVPVPAPRQTGPSPRKR